MFASKDVFLTPPATGGYTISRSVRLRSSASAYFNRTFGTPTNNLKWAWSGWVKRGKLGVTASLLDATPDAYAFNWANLYFTTADKLQFEQYSTGYNVRVITDAVFRDPSAWYHIFFIYDSANATANDRVQIWVNGVRQSVTYLTGPFAINTASKINVNGTVHREGVYSTDYADCYLADTYFIDGQTVTSSSFGETNAVTGVWQPKKYAGTYGANGSYLNFSDNSNNTAATIGKDYSGNGNNWTPNNISVTAGVTYDSMTDVPTLTSATAANYAVYNPLKLGSSGTWTVTDGNLAASNSGSSSYSIIASSIGVLSGKWYFEFTATNVGSGGNLDIGILQDGNSFGGSGGSASSIGQFATGYCYESNGTVYNNNTSGGSYSSFTTNDVVQMALDLDNNKIYFGKNGTWQNSGNPAAGTGQIYSVSAGTYFAAIGRASVSSQTGAATANFGQRPFTYTPPTGFVALNTYNLPASTITNGANYMAASTYTGTGATQTIANNGNNAGAISFQPDFVWVKGRSGATDHALYDSVRGTTKDLVSNSTAAETTQATGLTAFGSTGFTIGALAKMNTNTATYVGWQWKAGTTSSSNTNGSITSTVSVGATQGFSVVTWTATGSASTVGHGLGVVPNMIIAKSRIGSWDWKVYHTSIGNTGAVTLNTTAATDTYTYWNNTSPTSSVFSIGTSGSLNTSTNTMVAYCFAAVAGYSAFGSYTGNGSTDGPFVYTGFRPRFFLFKRTDSTGSWGIYDTSRDTYNGAQKRLYPDLSDAEFTDAAIDFLSNGFKIRSTTAGYNANGGTIIYAAFAENPFKNSLAR